MFLKLNQLTDTHDECFGRCPLVLAGGYHDGMVETLIPPRRNKCLFDATPVLIIPVDNIICCIRKQSSKATADKEKTDGQDDAGRQRTVQGNDFERVDDPCGNGASDRDGRAVCASVR